MRFDDSVIGKRKDDTRAMTSSGLQRTRLQRPRQRHYSRVDMAELRAVDAQLKGKTTCHANIFLSNSSGRVKRRANTIVLSATGEHMHQLLCQSERESSFRGLGHANCATWRHDLARAVPEEPCRRPGSFALTRSLRLVPTEP